MKKLYLIAFLLLVAPCSNAQQWEWAKAIGGTMWTWQWVFPDSAGNVFVGGDFKDSILIDQKKIFKSNDSNLFIAKLKSNGDCIWLKKFKGFYMHEMGVDKFSNIMIAWCDSGYENYDSNTAHLAKFDSSGNQLWYQPIKGGWAQSRKINLLQIDKDGDIYLKGRFSDTLYLGTLTLYNYGNATFIAKCKSDGTFLWAKKYPFEYNGSQNMVISGAKIFNMNVDSLVTLDTAGNILSISPVINNYGGNGNLSPILSIDKNGDLFVSGGFDQTISVGSYTFTDVNPCGQFNGGCGDILTFKMTQNGTVSWARHIYSSAFDWLNGTIVTNNGNVNVVGVNQSGLHIGGTTYNTQNSIFIINLNSNDSLNSVVFADNWYGTGSVWSSSVSTLNDDLYFTGGISTPTYGYVAFGNDTIRNYTGNFIAKLKASSGNVAVKSLTPSAPKITIFPNPSEGKFTINTVEIKQSILSIYNSMGDYVNRIELNGSNLEIDLTQYARGIYFVNINYGKDRVNKKIIIE